MNTASVEASPMRSTYFKSVRAGAAALLALLFAPSIAFAYGTCNAYINADGSSQARRGEGDCWVMDPTRVSAGVYKVGVNYPINEATDPATGSLIYTFHPGTCTVSTGNSNARASSVKMFPDIKPTSVPQTVPQGHSGTVTYTVRTFAAAFGPTLVPADQDFTLLCIN